MKRKYAVVYERTANNYAAYLPDLPGCISTGKTWEEIKKNIREAIIFHIEDMIACGTPVPHPQMSMDEAMVFHRRFADVQAGGVLTEHDDLVLQEDPFVGMVEVEVEALNNLERLYNSLRDVILFKNQDLVQQQIAPFVPDNDKFVIDEANQITYTDQITYTWPGSSYNVTTMSDPNNTEVLPKIDQNLIQKLLIR